MVRDGAVDELAGQSNIEMVVHWMSDEPTGALGTQEVAVFRDRELSRDGGARR